MTARSLIKRLTVCPFSFRVFGRNRTDRVSSALNADLAHMVETNQRLNDEVRKKAKAAEGFKSMYNNMRQHQLNADVGAAADHDADHVLQGAAAGTQRIPNPRTGAVPPRRSNSNGSGGSGEHQQRRMTLSYANGNNQTHRVQGSRAGLGSSRRSFIISFAHR